MRIISNFVDCNRYIVPLFTMHCSQSALSRLTHCWLPVGGLQIVYHRQRCHAAVCRINWFKTTDEILSLKLQLWKHFVIGLNEESFISKVYARCLIPYLTLILYSCLFIQNALISKKKKVNCISFLWSWRYYL
jgi:hypothetical protein